MSLIPWGPGRIVTLTVPSGGTTSDVLDLGGVAAVKGSGIASGVPTTTVIPTSYLTPITPVADFFKGMFIVFRRDTTTANLQDQMRLITASALDGTLTVTALTDAPAVGDVFDIWQAPGDHAKSYRRWDVVIHTPATVTGAVNIQLSPYEGGPFGTLQSGGADIVLPTGSKITPVIPLVGRFLRIFGAAQAQITKFPIVGVTITNER